MRQIPDYKKKEIDISNFKCVRVKYIRNQIKPQIRDFLCEKNYWLGQYLYYHAWPEELENYRAFYVVMDDEEIVMYFSLQMGSTIRCKKKRIGGVFYDSETKTHYIDTDKLEVAIEQFINGNNHFVFYTSISNLSIPYMTNSI